MITGLIKGRRDRCDDSGAMLIIALIIITTIALVTGALLTKGATNFSATVSLRGVAGTSYSGDAAAKVAINNLRLGSTATVPGASYPSGSWVYSNNIDGSGCFGLEGTVPKNELVLKNLYPKAGDQEADASARVECDPVPGTGLFGGGAGVDVTPQNGFLRAITTLDGDLTVTDNSTLQIRGGVASNGKVDADDAASTGIFTNGYLWANSGCTGNVTSTPSADCSHAKVSDPVVDDAFTSMAGLTPRDATTESCSGFREGYYHDAKALSDRTTACGTAIFLPGNYYFDFNDKDNGIGENVWKIEKTVIGGQVIGSGEPPGRCKSPIDDPSADGVRFVFGGTSRMEVTKDAHVELCGKYSDTAPPVVIQQQMTSGPTPPAPAPVSATFKAQSVSTAGSSSAFSPAATAATLAETDGNDTVWDSKDSSGSGKKTGVLALTDFRSSTAVPKGSTLQSAVLKIKHKEWGSPTAADLSVSVSDGSSTFTTVATPARAVSNANAAYPTNTADPVPSTATDVQKLTAILADEVAAGTLSAAAPTVRLSMSEKNIGMAIDSVQLELSFLPPPAPMLRAAQDTTIIGGFGNEFKGDFVLQGAVYAPKGLVDVNFGNNPDTVVAFRYGMAVRAANLAGHPQVLYGYPLVSIPDQGTGLGKRVTVVDLKVFVCAEKADCPMGEGVHALTARVMITDPPWALSGKPEPGKRKVEILSWAEQY